jgi:hypothetical protein
MTQPIVQHVAPLTESAQIVHPIVGRVTIKVRGRKNNARQPECGGFHKVRPPCRPPATVPPGRCALIEPASVR